MHLKPLSLLLLLSLSVALAAVSSDVGDASQKQGEVECLLCKEMVDALATAINEEENVEKIIAYLTDLVCPKLPAESQPMCEWFIGEYCDDVMYLLADAYLQPEEACATLGFCPAP